jgi:hypothetical protein
LKVLTTCSLAVVLALTVSLAVSTAHGYNYSSPFAEGCHERLSVEALSAVRERSKTARALPTSQRDRAWIDDLPLELPREARDLGAATLVAGVRDNDLKGAGSLEAAELAQLHGNPNSQREHCLRRPEHDEPTGTQRALEDCRDYILERFEVAVRDGFDDEGEVDPNARTRLEIDLDFAGQVRVPMPTAYLELGRALHALQDSFSHAIRSEDGLRVRVLLNWIDYVHDEVETARDGPVHRAALDECTGLDAVRRTRLRRASEASQTLLRAAFQADRSPDEKIADARAVLDRYLSFEDGCDAGNAYCDAPELRYSVSGMECGVGVAPGGTEGRRAGAGWVIALALVGLSLRGRRRVQRTGVVLCVLALASARVAAQDAATGGASNDAAYAVSPLALRGAISASIDEAGAALAAGARYGLSPRWVLGLDVEWNPWASLKTGHVRSGVLNAYATGVWRSPVSSTLALRVTGHAGVSTLLFDMYGSPSGSIGPYLGLSLLGLEVTLGSDLALVLEPADVVVTVPHLTGIPYIRRQYRATVALELRL